MLFGEFVRNLCVHSFFSSASLIMLHSSFMWETCIHLLLIKRSSGFLWWMAPYLTYIQKNRLMLCLPLASAHRTLIVIHLFHQSTTTLRDQWYVHEGSTIVLSWCLAHMKYEHGHEYDTTWTWKILKRERSHK